MSDCAKALNGITGTAHGTVSTPKDFGVLVARAFAHLLLNGKQMCTGTCDSGACGFGITSVSGELQVVNDAGGNGVTVTVTGDGKCFCG